MSRDRGQTTLDFAIGIGVFLIVVTFVFAFVPGALAPFEDSAREETAAADRIATQLGTSMLGDPGEPYHLDRECTIIFFEGSPSEDPANSEGYVSGGDDEDNLDGDGTFSNPLGPNSGSEPATYDGTCNFDDVGLEDRLALGIGEDVHVELRADLRTGEADSPENDGDELPNDPASADDEVADTLCLDANSDDIIEADLPSNTGDRCDVNQGDDDVIFEIGDEPPETGSVVSASRAVSIEGGLADGEDTAILVVEVW